MKYVMFIIDNRRFLAFGFLMTFFGSFGTTPMISLFSGEIRAEFGLSHGDFGNIYSIANLVGAAGIVWLGRKIDQMDLRLYSSLVCALLVVGSLLISWAPNVFFLFAAILLLRLAGPGLMNHTVGTSMVRYFDTGRGRALAVTAIGQPLSEAIFPTLVVLLIAALGWRGTWMSMGIVFAIVLIPLVLWLLRDQKARHQRLLDRLSANRAPTASKTRQWSRREVVRDPRFYLILPSVLFPPIIMAGLFFHQVHLVESKGWTLSLWAMGFFGFAVARVFVSLLSGPLIDKFGATRLLPYYILPLVFALLALAFFDHPSVAFVYMVLGGMSTGARTVAINAVWAEIYGVAHLGAIRSTVQALVMLAVAVSPATFGWLIDWGVTIEAIALMGIGLLLSAILLFAVFYLRMELQPPPR
ncbi:MAG: MFS transporter [Rhodospirillales bacterium]|jgi:MFS family permease|nr:MFS transporter [Rhodospirillales bacterium]